MTFAELALGAAQWGAREACARGGRSCSANHRGAPSKIDIVAHEKGHGINMGVHAKVRDMRCRFCESCGATRGTNAAPW
jgi:hypothetical protein